VFLAHFLVAAEDALFEGDRAGHSTSVALRDERRPGGAQSLPAICGEMP
jgi:hypothetical protein